MRDQGVPANPGSLRIVGALPRVTAYLLYNGPASYAEGVSLGKFPRRSEGIGLELCEGAARVSNKLTRGRGGFRFVPIFSREGGERLSAESIERILSEHSRNGRVKKLWVCGPPPMNETFERALEFLAPKYEISPQDCEVL